MRPYWHERIEISDHAKERIKIRIGPSPRKLKKIAQKAWQAPELTNDFYASKIKKAKFKKYYHEKNRVYREYMGYVFVFAVNESEKILVTVF
jgi:hypothetical protein